MLNLVQFHISMWCCVCFCFAKGKSGEGCLSASILFRYEFRMGYLFILNWTRVQQVAMRSVVLV